MSDVLVTQYNTMLNASMIPGGNAKSILQLIAEGNNKMVMPSVYRIGEFGKRVVRIHRQRRGLGEVGVRQERVKQRNKFKGGDHH